MAAATADARERELRDRIAEARRALDKLEESLDLERLPAPGATMAEEGAPRSSGNT
jgi:hypothetical protein